MLSQLFNHQILKNIEHTTWHRPAIHKRNFHTIHRNKTFQSKGKIIFSLFQPIKVKVRTSSLKPHHLAFSA